MRTFTASLLLVLLTQIMQAQPGKDEILWDTYGVPHIYGLTTAKMYYEFGWAQMHNHANLILKLYGQARGRAAEYWGEKYMPSDKQVQLFNVPLLAGKEYRQQDPGFKTCLDAFVAGMNDYARLHPQAVGKDERPVLPVSAEDVLAHEIRVIFLVFVAGENLGMASRKLQAGSNSYAIGPRRSTSGNALLLANPHLPWGDLFTFFEAHLQSPGFNAYGAAIVGLPVLNIAFNDHLGWTHTVNTINASSRYELNVQGDGYLLDSVIVPFEKRSVELKVRQSDGTLNTQTVELYNSRHGPVLGIKGDKAYAIRIAGLENPDILLQWHRMAISTSWNQFEAALKMMQLPMFNIVYADEKGNILYLFDGNVPKRAGGDWKFWTTTIDGSYSRYIWHQTLSYEDLPKVFNPSTAFVQNANDPPWTCTYPTALHPADYPAYISPQGMSLRPQRAVNMIKDDTHITIGKLSGYKLNTGMEAAERFLKDLLADVDAFPDSTALQAAAVLKRWNKSADSDSRGAVLFTRWFDKLTPDMFSIPWNPGDPAGTPSGLKNAKSAVDLLTQAAREVIKDYDSLDVAWGDVYRFRLNGVDLPANGGPEQYGIYRTIYFARDKDKKYRAVAGDSYVAVTEFSKSKTKAKAGAKAGAKARAKAKVLLSYGNASQPGSKHISDQLPLLYRKALRDAWLEKEEVLQHLEEREVF